MDDKYNLSKSAEQKLNAVIKEVLKDYKPSKSEIDDSKFAINQIMARLKKNSPKEVEILLAGSVARGTQVKGNSDIDIFLLFPRHMNEKAIERKGLEIGKSIVNKKKNESFIVKYAEHPYTRLFLNDMRINVDIVPAYKIKNSKDKGTAVDRTQLHNEFINAGLTDKQRDDVRILKAFLKAHNIYGAEARVEGFSGYLCELLVYHYGSFIKLITNIANSKVPIIIDIPREYIEADTDSIIKKFDRPMIVIDPTDSNRNVAANVSYESLFRFVLISRNLIESPIKSMFYNRKYSDIDSEKNMLSLKEKLGVNIYSIYFKVPNIAEDIIWQQLKKTRLRLHTLLTENGFRPIISIQNVYETDAVIGFFINDIHIDSTVVMGPSLEMGPAIEKFVKAHGSSIFVSVDRERIYAIEKSKYSNPEKLIRSFISSKSTKLPSYLSTKNSALYVNKIPEKYARLIYTAYFEKSSI